MLPNFFIVGTPKSGSTSLYYYLDEHPRIYMCPIKEPNYFSHKEIVRQNLYYKEKSIGDRYQYEKLFNSVKAEIAIGEASVSYLFYESTAVNIKKEVPEAKIIIILRNPADRAFSHFLMDQRLGLVELTFEDIVFKKACHPMMNLYYQQFIRLGFYNKQVERYIEAFGREKVKILLTEDLKENLENIILEILHFLNVEDINFKTLDRKHNVYRNPRNKFIKNLYSSQKLRTLAKNKIPKIFFTSLKNQLLPQANKPELSSETRSYLNRLFHDDIYSTSELINRDLTAWLLK
jgi:hypothetical protein